MQLVQVEYDDVMIGDLMMQITLEGEVVVVDCGIGVYEFWGSKGYHTDLRKEMNAPVYIEEVKLIDENGEPVPITDENNVLINDWLSSNLSSIEEAILEKATIDC